MPHHFISPICAYIDRPLFHFICRTEAVSGALLNRIMWLTKPPSPDDGRSSTSPKSRLPGMRGHRQTPGTHQYHQQQQQHQSQQSFTMHNNKRPSNQKPNVIISSYGVSVALLFLLLLITRLSEGASPESGGPSLEAVLSKGPNTHMTSKEHLTSQKHSPLFTRYAQLSQPSRVSFFLSKIQQEREHG